MSGATVKSEDKELVYASAGSGPMFQRDYAGTIEGGTCSPEALAAMVRERFVEFGPPETAAFEMVGGAGRCLKVGDELAIRIGGFMPCRVRVVHMDDLSLTLRTLAGHPEAGRISFKAGRDDQGRVTFQIRSRARSGGMIHYLGFLLLGRSMQARCWIRFIGRVAEACGGRLAGPVRVRTERVEERPSDCEGHECSTFSSDVEG
ncbi:DUF1990 family protein [Tundrisphaera sp. TA3]|uniref:DUF1990 family protein n=1 Tax=Tundrisphaera sp. TA3 TaxID=3435775 RepID=UPI003EC0E30E